MINLSAQNNPDEAYYKVAHQRAEKIIKEIQFESAELKEFSLQQITGFYINLKFIHESGDSNIQNGKTGNILNKAEVDKLKLEKERISESRSDSLKNDFLKKLSGSLSSQQIENIKEGITYGVAQKTYNAYLDMIPSLTEFQKDTIRKMLVEARETALSKGSSDEKHAVFGKYKGRINNFLSKQGYDLNKERAAWQERLKSES